MNNPYDLIAYFKAHPSEKTPENMIRAAHGFYKNNPADPFYLVDLGQSDEILKLIDQELQCEEQHYTYLKDSARNHYTGTFVFNHQRFKLHVFEKNEKGKQEIHWNLLDPKQPVLLTPEEMDVVTHYATFQAWVLTENLGDLAKEHKRLITEHESIFENQQQYYKDNIFQSSFSNEAQFACLQTASTAIEELLNLNPYNRKYYDQSIKLKRRLKLFVANQNLRIVSNEEFDLKSTTDTEEAHLLKQLEPQPLSKQADNPTVGDVIEQDESEVFLHHLKAIQELYGQLAIPTIVIDGKIALNPEYLSQIIKIDEIYFALCEQFLYLPDAISLIQQAVVSPVHEQLKDLEIKHHREMLQFFTNLIFLGQTTDFAIFNQLQHANYWLAKLKPEVFRKPMRDDNVTMVLFLLDVHLSLQSQLPVKIKKNTLVETTMQKSVLEILIAEKAQESIAAIAKKMPINLLDLGSDNKPLVCQIFCLDVNDPFRQRCFDDISILKSRYFYTKLINLLQKQGDDEAVLMARIEMNAYCIPPQRDNNSSLIQEKCQEIFSSEIVLRRFKKVRVYTFYSKEIARYVQILEEHNATFARQLKEKIKKYLPKPQSFDDASVTDLINHITRIPEDFWTKSYQLMYKATQELFKFLHLHIMWLSGKQSHNENEMALEKKMCEFYFERFIKMDTVLYMPARKNVVLKKLKAQINDINMQLSNLQNKPNKYTKNKESDLKKSLREFNEEVDNLTHLNETEALLRFSLKDEFTQIFNEHPDVFLLGNNASTVTLESEIGNGQVPEKYKIPSFS